jgi:hypothetical protein
MRPFLSIGFGLGQGGGNLKKCSIEELPLNLALILPFAVLLLVAGFFSDIL